jgi:arsenite methyltransferase
MDQPNKIRDDVSRAYAQALTTGSCCSSSAPESWSEGAAAYGSELQDLPADAIINSFGCGNPLAFSDLTEGETVLDLGSGAGLDLIIAAKMAGPTGHVIGVDMTDEMIERATANLAAAGLANAEVRRGIIEDLPVESGSVDLLISNCVINLSPEKERVFREIVRVLKPGGRMRVSDIVAEELPEWARRSLTLYSSCIAGAIPEADYLDGLRAAGLIDAEVQERLVYDAQQLEALAGADSGCCGPSVDSGCDCGAAPDPIARDTVTRELVGKVWSAKFSARKPG